MVWIARQSLARQEAIGTFRTQPLIKLLAYHLQKSEGCSMDNDTLKFVDAYPVGAAGLCAAAVRSFCLSYTLSISVSSTLVTLV